MRWTKAQLIELVIAVRRVMTPPPSPPGEYGLLSVVSPGGIVQTAVPSIVSSGE